MSKLTELNNFSVTISPLSVDLLKWVDAFQSLVNTNVIIDSLQISNIELEPDIIGRFSISGHKDVRDALQRITKGKRFELDRIQVKLPYEDRTASLQLTNAAAVKLEDVLIDDILPALRQSLPAPK